MKIDLLLCFLAAEKYRNFSQAAESLYITQSTLSKKIKALEALLGGELFIRNNSAVDLTPYGEYMLGFANKIVDDYKTMSNAADDYNPSRQRKLRIATFSNFAYSGIVTPIARFERREENFYIETNEVNHSRMQTLMETHQAEICIAYSELIKPVSGYAIYHLQSTPLVLICSRGYAAERGWGDLISLSDAKDSRFCFPREDSELFCFYNDACRAAGFMPVLTSSFVRLSTIAQYMRVGIRCTLNLSGVAHSAFHASDFAIIDLRNAPVLSLSLYVDTTHHSTIKQRFVESLLDYYQDDSPQKSKENYNFFL